MTAILQLASAAPWLASASRRRPPLRGGVGGRAWRPSRGCGGRALTRIDGAGVKPPGFPGRLRSQLGIQR
jgi:hypothetical protein